MPATPEPAGTCVASSTTSAGSRPRNSRSCCPASSCSASPRSRPRASRESPRSMGSSSVGTSGSAPRTTPRAFATSAATRRSAPRTRAARRWRSSSTAGRTRRRWTRAIPSAPTASRSTATPGSSSARARRTRASSRSGCSPSAPASFTRMPSAAATVLTTIDRASGRTLDAWYPQPVLGAEPAPVDGLQGRDDDLRGVTVEPIITVVDDLDAPPADTPDAYLRLHLLSHRLVRPHAVNLDGIFGVLPNVAWTSLGPVDIPHIEAVRLRARIAGRHLSVYGVDKFPRMTDYVVPPGVRIADADRVRLGAHLADGTTVMHEGFVNFNGGTLGSSMVEGRISAGVVVGDGSDVGGGASIMGTLSGGGSAVVSIGRNCLVGANAGLGISLGDECVVEAGLYLTAGTRVVLPDGEVTKARELSGADNLLFRRNSQSGAVEALPRSGTWGGLNAALHAHQ